MYIILKLSYPRNLKMQMSKVGKWESGKPKKFFQKNNGT